MFYRYFRIIPCGLDHAADVGILLCFTFHAFSDRHGTVCCKGIAADQLCSALQIFFMNPLDQFRF